MAISGVDNPERNYTPTRLMRSHGSDQDLVDHELKVFYAIGKRSHTAHNFLLYSLKKVINMYKA